MRTITFYSYKGGTGRTLAVANIARLLARFGSPVFVLDLDLEAPGLHYKLGLRKPGEDGTSALAGVVDFLHSFTFTGQVPRLQDAQPPYVHTASLPSTFKGKLHLLPAGDAPSPGYSRRLSEIRLAELFNPPDDAEEGAKQRLENLQVPLAIPLFLELQAQIEQDYRPAYLLIDSRTGITEIGGIAVRLMPDTLVCLIHNNPENIAGARKILRNVRNAPRKQGKPPIEIVLVLARIPEMGRAKEKALAAEVLDYFNAPAIAPEHTLALEESDLLFLHSDPELQILEELLIGGSATANDSVLLRDYYKLFLKLDLQRALAPDERALLEDLAGADEQEGIRSLIVGARRLQRESALAPVTMFKRWQSGGDLALKVVAPAYLTGDVYKDFVCRVCTTLTQRLAHDNGLPVREDPVHKVRWDLLAVHLREGILDFCADIYYLTESRGLLVDIVQLGWCRTFGGFLRADSPLLECLVNADRNSGFADRMRALLATQFEIAIAVLGDTPAASETNRNLGRLLAPERLISKGSEDDLLEWLRTAEKTPAGDKPIHKLALCDHVVITTLKEKASDLLQYDSNLTFTFAQPIPIGIVYPREDRAWRRFLAATLAQGLCDFLTARPRGWNHDESLSVPADFSRAGIEALPLDDLRRSLLLDLPLEVALDWNVQMRSLGEARGILPAGSYQAP